MTTTEALQLMTDEAERLNADTNDSTGVIRAIVTAHGLSFNAWFCVCCELADRKARAEAYENQGHRAASLIRRPA